MCLLSEPHGVGKGVVPRALAFNDDMQGTGAIVMSGLFNALKVASAKWRDQRVVVLGGGTAGIRIADQIRDQTVRDGLNAGQATRQIWIVDLPGLLTDDMSDGLLDYQRPYARPTSEVSSWAKDARRSSAGLCPSISTKTAENGKNATAKRPAVKPPIASFK